MLIGGNQFQGSDGSQYTQEGAAFLVIPGILVMSLYASSTGFFFLPHQIAGGIDRIFFLIPNLAFVSVPLGPGSCGEKLDADRHPFVAGALSEIDSRWCAADPTTRHQFPHTPDQKARFLCNASD